MTSVVPWWKYGVMTCMYTATWGVQGWAQVGGSEETDDRLGFQG